MTFDELKVEVRAKFRYITTVDDADITDWCNSAIRLHGYTDITQVPANEQYLLVILAQAEGCSSLALNTAYYFRYQDAEEMVDKTQTSKQYMTLSNNFRQRYNIEAEKIGANISTNVVFCGARRIDR